MWEQRCSSPPSAKKIFLFTDPYITEGLGVITKKTAANITPDDVRAGNVSIACMKGSTYESWLREHFGTEQFDRMVAEGRILLKYTQDAAVYAVLANEAEAALGTDSVLSRTQEYSPLVYLGRLTEKRNAGFVLKKSDTELAAKINAGLAHLRESGEYTKILDKYNLPQLKSEYTRLASFVEVPPDRKISTRWSTGSWISLV